MNRTVAQKRAHFAELHASGCFVIPNPWDVGSAKYLASLGFKALATTSAGMAFAAGRPDNGVTRALALRHIAELAEATELPLNADFEDGFGATPEDVHDSVRLCVGAGVAGLSIEDFTADPKAPFYRRSEAVDRLRAARAAIDASGEKVMLVARSEALLNGHPDGLAEALRRIARFAEVGADVLYVPGLKSEREVREVLAVAGKLPVNVLVGAPTFTVQQLADLGVRRISVGGALARAAWGGFMRAAREIAEQGRFGALADGASYKDLNALFT